MASNNLETLRHSTSHLLAAAVMELYPNTKLGIGPAIENGFYYDFDLPSEVLAKGGLSMEDLPAIEKKMREIATKNLEFKKEEISKEEAREIFKNQNYKLELINELPSEKVTIYKTGDFIDLCAGPHLKNSAELKYFKLLSVAGAYWRGSENNPMLQRIYGTAWKSETELKKHLQNLEEAKKRDHRKIGQELDLFSFHNESPGMVYFHPKGKIIFEKLIVLSRKMQKEDYLEVSAPNLLNVEVWKKSGHWEHYKDAMYFAGGKDEEPRYGLRPMDCPGEILIYQTKTRSYRDLPLRYSEYGTITRKELSGTLSGLFRLQQFTQDDAHIFCTEEQISNEISGLIKLIDVVYHKFDLSYKVYLSTRPNGFMGKREAWERAEEDLRQALTKNKIEYTLKEGEGAFYGPKIDFDILDAMSRAWQCATIQLDFQMPEKFNLEYTSSDGKIKRPVIIHRTILGAIERFMGILLEHFNGALPIFLAPVQVIILPVSEKVFDYSCKVYSELKEADLRVDCDMSNETLAKKIREAELQKIPYILVVGEREEKAKTVAVRKLGKKESKTLSLGKFLAKIKN